MKIEIGDFLKSKQRNCQLFQYFNWKKNMPTTRLKNDSSMAYGNISHNVRIVHHVSLNLKKKLELLKESGHAL